MKTFFLSALGGLIGYGAGALGGAGLIKLLSSNTHDKSLETVMTAFFVTGPLVGLLAFCGTLIYRLVMTRG